MKAILINSSDRTITAVEYDGLGGLQALIGGSIETACMWPNGDVLYVDEEGLYKPQTGAFQISARPDGQPLVGRGVVVGREVKDDSAAGYHTEPPAHSIETLTGMVTFLTLAEAQAWASGRPAATLTTLNKDGTATTEAIGSMAELYAEIPEPAKEPEPETALGGRKEKLPIGEQVMVPGGSVTLLANSGDLPRDIGVAIRMAGGPLITDEAIRRIHYREQVSVGLRVEADGSGHMAVIFQSDTERLANGKRLGCWLTLARSPKGDAVSWNVAILDGSYEGAWFATRSAADATLGLIRKAAGGGSSEISSRLTETPTDAEMAELDRL
jgi:hypothetical protein